jgi:uncharacterized protein DUF6600/FecR-like protein
MLFVAVVVCAVAMPVLADPPGRAGRLSLADGAVSFQPGGVDDWVTATQNRPITTSDRLWTDSGSHAEVTFGNLAVRQSSGTSLTFTNLDDNTTQVELDQGLLWVHVNHLHDGEVVEVDTPNLAFTVNEPGDYRLRYDPNDDTTTVTVRRGSGQAVGQGPSYDLAAGQSIDFSNGQSMTANAEQMPEPDSWDQWNMQRDRRYEHPVSAQYVSEDVVGYEDLDDNGSWAQNPQYGAIWVPRVAVGWAPYHTGHWAWVDPWGYTWVDDAPWGFAPFHYGRWVSVGGAWGWSPGPRPVVEVGVAYVRPVYAPALVAFIGGGGFGVSVGVGGGVGWVPLGWGEPYYPSYHVSEAYVRNVNVTSTHITNITVVTNNYTTINNTTVINNVHYANQSVAGAVTVVPRDAMAGGKPVAQAAVKVDPKEIANAKFSSSAGVVPQKEAVLGGKAPVSQHTPPPAALQRQVVSKNPPPAPPAKFEAKQQLLQKSGGRPLEASETKSLPTVQRPAPKAAAVKPAAPAPKPGVPATPAKNNPPAPGKPIPANTPAPKPTPAPTPAKEPAKASEPKPMETAPASKPVAHPPAAEPKPNTVPHPPEKEATPAAKPKTAPPAKENKPSKEEKKPEKNEKPDR